VAWEHGGTHVGNCELHSCGPRSEQNQSLIVETMVLDHAHVTPIHAKANLGGMMATVLCLIVLAMPFAVVALTAWKAWVEPRRAPAKADRLNGQTSEPFVDLGDDDTLFR
jgi:hypothetical protein